MDMDGEEELRMILYFLPCTDTDINQQITRNKGGRTGLEEKL